MGSTQRNIGAYVALRKGVNPANSGAATINGAALDRLGYLSAVLHLACGAASGAPTARTVDAKLQDSADGSAGWADLSGAAVAQLTADNGESYVDVDLSAAKRYIRAVVTVTFTGGTTPTIPVAATVLLGGRDELPAP